MKKSAPMLDMGPLLITMARQSSFWFIRADGVEQAKFREPRALAKNHAFDKLVCPTVHGQGALCEGLAYNSAVADANMKE